MSKSSSQPRHLAREMAMQALYQWQFTHESLTEIECQFHEDNDLSLIDADYFSELLHKIPADLTDIDDHIKNTITRSFEELNPVELSVLRIGVYELIHRPDVPYKVIINEALRITKKFGAADGFKFVNGVLDKLAKKLRTFEVTRGQNRD